MAAADMASAPSPQSDDGCCTDNTNKVEAFVILAVVAMFHLHVLGSLRRRSCNSVLHAVVMGAYTLSYPLVGYTIGLMNSSCWYYDDFSIWPVFLLLLLGNTDSLTACRLSDIDNWKSIYIKHLFKGILLVSIVLRFGPGTRYRQTLSAILFVAVLKWYVMIASMRTVSKEYLYKKVKVIAEYMKHKDNLVVPYDPVTMEGYQYMVVGEKNCGKRPGDRTTWYDKADLKITTVEQIWQCTGNLLVHGRRANMFKDLCLSMALSKMLNRRFAGFMLSEASLDKTHDMVFKGLLVGDKPYERVFRVIEEELSFVHDLYYTRYYYLYQKGRYFALCLPVIMFALCSWLTYLLVKNLADIQGATIFITVVLAFLEAYQLYLFIASGWFKVALILSYITTPTLQRSGCFLEMVIGHLLRLKAFRPWKARLGQYCIIHELGHKSWVTSFLHYATLRLLDKAKNKKGCKKSVKLSDNVKKAMVDSLLGCNGRLTNGVTSLQNNGLYGHLSWACDATATDGSVTRTIMVWHVATTLCEQLDPQAKQYDTVASTISRYCLHLLVFAPNLLPDHSSVSDSILDQSIDEASMFLKGNGRTEKMLDRCKLLMAITADNGGDGGAEARLVAQGARLARYLIQDIKEPVRRWKVLSDFWAEMMLYVSPSNDARAHLEALPRGGEFITHLWALLTHAGILKVGPTWPEDIV